nr:glycosyltransferase [Roseateles koreensis]
MVEQVRHLRRVEPIVVTRNGIAQMPAGLNCAVIAPPGHKWRKHWFTATRSASLFLAALQGRRPQLIHAHFGPDAVMALPAARRLNVPLVVTYHGYDAMFSDRQMLSDLVPTQWHYVLGRRQLMREAACILVVSDFLRRQLIARGFDEHRVRVHHIGVDTDLFKPPGDGGADRLAQGRYVLNVARHVDVKGISVLLRAWRKVADRHPDAQLLQVGSGPLTESLLQLCNELGLGQSVRFLGAQAHSRVIDLMQHASAVVLCSLTPPSGQQEALGIVLNEASACGVPVIGSRNGGIPEAIVDGETGFVVPENDCEALTARLCELWQAPVKARAMGLKGREFVLKHFNIRVQSTHLEDIYLQLIQAGSHDRAMRVASKS